MGRGGEARSSGTSSGVFVIAVLCISVTLWTGCSRGAAPAGQAERADEVDLAGRLMPVADPGTAVQGGDFRRGVPVTRKGIREVADVLIAPAAAEVHLEGMRGPAVLELRAAPVFNAGDGVGMEIVLVQDGVERGLYSRVFDAARNSADREWVPVSVPVDFGGHGESVLRIRASAGPQGDLVGDWLALASPRLRMGGGR